MSERGRIIPGGNFETSMSMEQFNREEKIANLNKEYDSVMQQYEELMDQGQNDAAEEWLKRANEIVEELNKFDPKLKGVKDEKTVQPNEVDRQMKDELTRLRNQKYKN